MPILFSAQGAHTVSFGLLTLRIIAALTFRYHSHAACGAAVTLQDYCVFHWLERRARLRRAIVGMRI